MVLWNRKKLLGKGRAFCFSPCIWAQQSRRGGRGCQEQRVILESGEGTSKDPVLVVRDWEKILGG